MKSPKISIIIPSLNQGIFLESCLRSITDQNYPLVEIILIDGGSTDNTHKIVEKFKDHISIFISEPDKGQSDALNKGLALATGEIIGWQNADDSYVSNAFFEIASAFLVNPKFDVIYGNRYDIDIKNNIIGRSCFTQFSPLIAQYGGMWFGTQSTFWRSSSAKKIGPFDIDLHYAMDLDYFLKAHSLDIKFHFINKYIGSMRRHDASKTENNLGTSKHNLEIENVYRRYYKTKKKFHKAYKISTLCLRWIYYIKQGDISYSSNGILRRIKQFFSQ